MPWLIRAECWDPAIPGIRSIHLSDLGLVTRPADSPADTYWARRITMPPSIARAVFQGGEGGGQAEQGFGTAVIDNTDARFDALNACTFAGHTVEVLFSALPSPQMADFAIVLRAVSRGEPTIGAEMRMDLGDRMELVERAFAPATFAGTGGAEGTAEWASVTRPRSLGLCLQVEPASIGGAANVVSYGEALRHGGPLSVRDQGIYLRRGLDYPDHASMMAAAFGDVEYLTCDAIGQARFRSPPVGPLTMDLAGRTIGAQLVANGDFASGLTGWTTGGAGWSGTSRADKAGGAAGSITRAITTQAGAWYVLAMTRSAGAGLVQPRAAGVTLGEISADRRRAFVFQASAASTVIGADVDAAFAGWIDDITCWQVAARAAEMISLILDEDTPLSTADLTTADFTTLDAAQPAALQLHHPARASARVPEMVSLICATVGASWGLDPVTGLVRLRRWEAPAVTADFEIGERLVEAIEPVTGLLRLRQQTINWAVRNRPLTENEVAAGVTDVERVALIAAFQPAIATHAATATEAKAWRDEVLDSLFVHQAPADAEAARRAALTGPLRLSLRVRLARDIAGADIGQTARLVHRRFGFAAGRNMRVLNAERDGIARTLTLTLWG